MGKRVTIYDIAKEAGVSAATVSYVINNREGQTISEESALFFGFKADSYLHGKSRFF